MKKAKEVINHSLPHVVRPHIDLTNLVDEVNIAYGINVFRVQYPVSQQAKAEGSGQTPFTGGRKQKIQELLLRFRLLC